MDESQAQQPTPENPQPEAAQPEPVQEASAPEQPVVEEAQEPEAADPQPEPGGDVSTTSATGPVPPPGVPAEPINAIATDGSIPGPRMDPARIGEATRPVKG